MTLRKAKIVLLSGDGVGPEVVAEGVKVLKMVVEKRGKTNKIEFEFVEELIGGAAIDATGSSLPAKTLESTKSASAILLGAVGGPEWPRSPGSPRPEQGLLEIRKSLDLYANLRPVSFASDSLIGLSSLKETVAKGTDFIFVRELVGGIYFGARREATAENPEAMDTCTYSEAEIQRLTRLAAYLALKHNPPLDIHSIDKANVLATSRLWRKVVTETLEKEFPKIKFDHCLVDSAAMHMIQNPKKLNGVILTENMFGDILSDEASVIVGSLGLLPSASLNGLPDGKGPCVGLYEPIHGSAPDIAGQGVANPIATILSVALLLRYSLGLEREAEAVEQAVRKTLDDYESPGMGLEYRTKDLGGSKTTSEVGDKVVEVLETLLEGLNSSDRTTSIPRNLLLNRPTGRRPMTMCEKIITHAAINLSAPGHVKPGDMVCVSVDWTIASELTWKGMDKTYDLMGRPDIYRNDRFWLAIDHTVDPRINHMGKAKELIKASEDFAKEAKLVDFYTPNFSILHTEFYRERAQPGQLIIGADSHTCSAGGLGCMAIGLGAGDVVMPLVTGETFLKVPETVEIKFVGQPPFGIGGKDTILYVLGELKRNTVAFERAVEYTGPGLKYLSPDARFAIANMSTEFGGIAGVCEADEQTAAFIAKRKSPMHRNNALYFRADPDAQYVESHVIDLSKVESLVALYPSPDNVVGIKEVEGNMKLDGVFIGACTTAEEDLILAALVLEAGLKKGMVPVKEGKRKVTPGSVPILAKLRRLGLLKVYEQAGYDIGAPGCSYCIAVAADKALPGEVWLSSQNRNFKNRMGPGSIANLASAATVAASSFGMTVMDPRELLDAIDRDRYKNMLDLWLDKTEPITLSEPNPILFDPEAPVTTASDNSTSPSNTIDEVSGKVQRFEDNVDTDAIIPAQFMPGKDDADLGTHAFQYVRPEFVERAKQGFNIVVGGIGFGSGSSREEAPRALKGAGVKAVIAKSYAFIYQRNQPNMALLGVTVKDEEFYTLAQEGVEVSINVKNRTVSVAGKTFSFGLSVMEERLIAMGGVTEMYKQFGKRLFRVATAPEKKSGKPCGPDGEELAW